MTTTEQLADTWTPVPLRWRHVQLGDVIAGGGLLWSVVQLGGYGTALNVRIACGARDWSGEVDPDETVSVLVPLPERDAVELTRDQLGARLTERRSGSAMDG